MYRGSITSLVSHTEDLLQEQLSNLMGHKFRVVALRHFPFMDYQTVTKEPGSAIIPTDCMDTRFLNIFSAKLNFTYYIYEQRESQWGVPTDGVFDGMIGELQREETDFCLIAAPTPERLRVTEYARAYPSTDLVIVSLKPTLLPEFWAFFRPFKGELWLGLLVSVVVWGVTLWLLQRAWHWASGGRGQDFITALMYGWGALLQTPPSDPSVNVSGQVLVGWWLVFCLIIGTAFTSSLIAHLTVQEKSPTLETFQDLLNQQNWKWGTEKWLLSGVPLEYFSRHFDPVVQQIYKKMQILPVDEALKNVAQGSFSFITFKEYVSIIIASRYADSLGNTPFYISKTSVSMMAAFGWCIRKGAPFYPRFSQLMRRLEDSGVTAYWRQDVIARRVRENRETAALQAMAPEIYTANEDKRQVVLGLNHLKGAFYLLLVGCGVAFLILVGENLVH
ncbi:glutamate receptor U1-like [Cherax quadricarinatus]|uniref:glutamate receptor U1-like n=1 Tax=Cherax quadricarinatus TaxID=27406 RepID=UPI00387E8E84